MCTPVGREASHGPQRGGPVGNLKSGSPLASLAPPSSTLCPLLIPQTPRFLPPCPLPCPRPLRISDERPHRASSAGVSDEAFGAASSAAAVSCEPRTHFMQRERWDTVYSASSSVHGQWLGTWSSPRRTEPTSACRHTPPLRGLPRVGSSQQAFALCQKLAFQNQ